MGTQEGEKTLSRQELGRAFPWDGIHRAMGSPRENEESNSFLSWSFPGLRLVLLLALQTRFFPTHPCLASVGMVTRGLDLQV